MLQSSRGFSPNISGDNIHIKSWDSNPIISYEQDRFIPMKRKCLADIPTTHYMLQHNKKGGNHCTQQNNRNRINAHWEVTRLIRLSDIILLPHAPLKLPSHLGPK
ncbi:hypothetical protein FKM82_007518 [Ascaphus truei]